MCPPKKCTEIIKQIVNHTVGGELIDIVHQLTMIYIGIHIVATLLGIILMHIGFDIPGQ